MSVKINASTTSGLVVDSDLTGSLKLQTGGNDALTVSSSQVVNFNKQYQIGGVLPPAFSAYSSAGANITSSTWTKVTLDTELYDTNNNFASSTFTPTVAGYYQTNFTSTNAASGNNAYWLYNVIYKNGAAYIGAYSVFPSGNIQNFSNNLSQVIYMNGSTDYLEFYVNIYVPSGTPSYGGGYNVTLASSCLLRAA
jgi:hypothetical protein